jgi:hypothetical protein
MRAAQTNGFCTSRAVNGTGRGGGEGVEDEDGDEDEDEDEDEDGPEGGSLLIANES